MGTHGRPVMGSHRPGPMGPSIVLAPPPGWPDVARSQHFKCRRVAPAGRRLAGVSPASVRSFAKPRADYASSNHTPALRASRNHCTRAFCAVLAAHNACVERALASRMLL